MAGHSKWSNIKHKKQAEDAKRGRLFTKLSSSITAAVKEGGEDADINPSLRLAIDKAKEANMPKDKIQNAIDRANGVLGKDVEQVYYEFYGPGGTALVVGCVTDNKNRTAASVRTVLNKHALSLGSPNSAAYIFNNGTPSFMLPIKGKDKETLNSLIDDLEEIEEVESIVHNAQR